MIIDIVIVRSFWCTYLVFWNRWYSTGSLQSLTYWLLKASKKDYPFKKIPRFLSVFRLKYTQKSIKKKLCLFPVDCFPILNGLLAGMNGAAFFASGRGGVGDIFSGQGGAGVKRCATLIIRDTLFDVNICDIVNKTWPQILIRWHQKLISWHQFKPGTKD